MTTAVAIANLALSHLGDDATVVSLEPPEGSAQAEQAALFYPIARDALVEMYPWNFALRRATLALLEEEPVTQWAYGYALPSNVLGVFSVQGPDDTDDFVSPAYGPLVAINGVHDFEIEGLADGTRVLYTNVADARIRYTVAVTVPSFFPPLFTLALSYFLASFLAGPVLKGETGRTVAAQMLQIMGGFLNKAQTQDAKQRRASRVRDAHVAPWVGAR
jgi:hypothetical protein